MLSSVRRLVSSELPDAIRSGRPEKSAALVLTQAHRVDPTLIGHNSRRRTLEDRIAELEAAVADKSDEWEPDGSEDQAQHRPDRIVYKRSEPLPATPTARRRSLRLSEIALIETGPANDDAAAEMVEDERDAPAVAFRHDEGEARETASEPGADRPGADLREPEADTAEDADVVEDIFPTAAQSEASVEADEADVDDAETLAAVEQALTAELTEGIAAAVEDELSEDAEFDAALADAIGKLQVDETTEGDTASLDEAPSGAAQTPVVAEEPAPTDLAALRPMVSALIREELQGELGERITRNVRKLVRQEINRALAARELE